MLSIILFSLIVQLLKLRYLQLKRDLGYWVFILAIAIVYLTTQISEGMPRYGLAIAGIFIFGILNYHVNRKDLNFLTKYFHPYKTNIALNYNLLALPISVGLLINNYWQLVVGLHVISTFIIFINVKTSGPKLTFISRYLPASQFEWIAGLRKNLYILIPLLLIALFLSPVKFFAAVALFLVNSVFIGFYNSFEPMVMMNPEELSASDFLKHKVKFFHRVLLLINAPLLIVNSIFHPDIAWFNVCFIVGFLLIATSSIYIKYANYKPNDELRFQIDFLLLFASAVIPFLLPISFFLTQSYRKKAFQNLSNYIDDHSQNSGI